MSATTVGGASVIGADLGRIVGAANVEIRPTALVPYRTDATFGFSGIPRAVVRPGSTDEVSRILRWANQRGIPVVPRGAGTSLAAGAVPVHGGVVLALTRMDRIVSIDPVDLTAVVQPGVTTQTLARAVAEFSAHSAVMSKSRARATAAARPARTPLSGHARADGYWRRS